MYRVFSYAFHSIHPSLLSLYNNTQMELNAEKKSKSFRIILFN